MSIKRVVVGLTIGAEEIMVGKVQVYKDNSGEFRFRLLATSGQAIVLSKGYKTKASATLGAKLVRISAAETAIEDLTADQVIS